MNLAEIRAKVPELAGLDDEHAVDFIHQAYYPNIDRALLAGKLGVTPSAAAAEEPGMLRSAGDSAIALGRGVVGGVKMVTDAFGADNQVSRALGNAQQSLSSVESPHRQAERAARAQKIQAAEATGSTWEEIKANLGALADAPLDTILEAAGTIAPTAAAALIPGLGQANLARAALMAGTGAVQGAGSVKGTIHDAVVQKLAEAGASPEQAATVAAEAQAYAGPNAGQITLGALLGGVAGRLGVEQALVRGGGTAPGVMRRALTGAAAEAVPEAAQGGQERLASNLALQSEGFEVPTMQGVAGQAAIEAAAGGVLGGAASVKPAGPMARAVQAGEQAAVETGLGPMEYSAPPPVQPATAEPALAPDASADGVPFEADPRFEAAPVYPNGQAPAVQRFGTRQAADIAIGEAGVLGLHEVAEVEPSVFEIRPRGTGAAMIAPGIYEGQASDPAPKRPLERPAPTKENVDATTAGLAEGAGDAQPAVDVGGAGDSRALAEGERSGGPADPGVPVAPVAGTETAEPVAVGGVGDAALTNKGEFKTADEAKQYISTQRRAASANLPAALPIEFDDGSFGVSTADHPEFELAQQQDQQRRRKEAGIEDGDVLTGDGNPFKNRSSASARAARMGAGHAVAKVNGGWVVRKDYVAEAASQAATSPTNDLKEPTPAQVDAGNFVSGHVKVAGFDITLQWPKGSTRKGTGADGKEWSREMKAHYGHIKRTIGADGDQVDVYVGDNPDAPSVYVVDQIKADGSFDEHKAMVGFENRQQAETAYVRHYPKGWTHGGVTEMSVDEFKAWLKEGDTTKPVSPTVNAGTAGADGRPPSGAEAVSTTPAAPAPTTPSAPVTAAPAPPASPSSTTTAAPASKKKREPAGVGSDREPPSIQDAGEKIGGARKDRWKERGLDVSDLDAMSESEGATLATKANVWKPDYDAIAQQSEPVTAAMVKVVYDQLAAQPKNDTPQGRRDYVRAMQAVRKVYGAVRTVKEAMDAYQALRTELDVRVAEGVGWRETNDKDAKRVLFSVYKGRSDPFVFNYNELSRAKKLVQDGFPTNKAEPWTRRFSVRADGGKGTTDAGVRIYMERAAAFGTPLTEEQVRAGFFSVRTKAGQWAAALPTKADAEAAAKTIYERTLVKESTEEPERPHLDALKRENLAKTIDRDVTQDDFLGHFGFRGVEFGNWSAQDERQKLLNLAYDGLNDLAMLLNVPPKAISLNGTMGMAFGSRGGGRFAAHYEPGKLVINMTKIRGSGSLAHEWAHALDHYLGELARDDAYKTKARGASGWYQRMVYDREQQKKMAYEPGTRKLVSVATPRLTNLRPELAESIDAVMETLFVKDKNQTNYAREAQKLSGKSEDGYWIRPTEMWARAFESYVFDRLVAMGAKSEYLVHGVEADRFAAADRYKGNPYPVGSERAAINAAFDKMVAEIKTRETDAGVAMFSRAGEPLETRPFFAGKKLAGRASPKQAMADVADVLGFEPNVPVLVERQGGAPEVPMRYDPQQGVILYNTSSKHTRTEDVQYMLEEVLHAVDDTGGGRMMSAANPRFLPSGDIRAELEAARTRSAAMRDVLDYPLEFTELSDERVAAELFARAGVLYYGHPRLLKATAATTYEAYEQALGRQIDNQRLQSEVRQHDAGDAEARVQPLGEPRVVRGDEGRDQSRQGDGLQSLREAVERAFGARGRAAAGTGSLETSSAGLPREQAQQLSQAFEDAGLKEVKVVGTAADLPPGLRKQMEGTSGVRGAYFPSTDEVFVIADQVHSAEELTFVALHEAFHRGLRKLFPDAKPLLRQMWNTNQNLRKRTAAIETALKVDRDTAIEEALADMAGEGQAKELRGWGKLFKLISTWLEKVAAALNVDLAFSDSMIETFVAGTAGEGLKRAPPALGDATSVLSRSVGERISDAADKLNRGPAIVGQTNRQYTPQQLQAMKNVGFQVEPSTVQERAKALWQDAGKKLAQGLVDQFAPVKDISKEAYGLLRLAKGASGAFETLLRAGQLKLSDNVYDFDETNRGGVVDKLLIPLQGEHHDFFRWVAANRAAHLKGLDKENLFSNEDIVAIKSLADGSTSFDYTIQTGVQAGKVTRDRTLIYADALRVFNGYHKNVLDMAEQSGLIDAEARALWESEFYVPFYRVEDDGSIAGADIKAGAVRQQAFKSLTGRTNKLNADLLDNVLMNWAHLLDAAAKNRAAKASIEAAEKMGAAARIDGHEGKGSVWFRENGSKRFSMVNDPYLLTAITALEYAGMRSPVMKAMGAFKHALTVGVTASPFFKVRNLIRDSVQVIGTSGIDPNIAKNIAHGWRLTDPKSDAYFRLLAGGGTIHFGTMMEGSEAKRVQALVESGVDAATILDSEHKVKAFYRKVIEPAISAYNELGNRGEAINRAALYDQLVKQGMSHAEASLQARDLLDFSMQGSFTTVRFLAQVVPFFNARIQGMYKLGRAAKEDPARFSAVIGAAALMSVGLLAAFGDDDDWKKREDWDRNNYWWFKFGGTAFRIPKPFEIGAIATLAERGFELAFDKEMTGKRFRAQVLTLLGDNLSMNPVPQLVKPMLDVYANQDSFTGRPIESMGMEKLQSEYRFTDRTSMTARALSTAANTVTGLVGAEALSPVQIDHMLRGYFGWLGSFVVGAGDVLARPATGQPSQAAPDYWKTATGGMVSDLRDAPSRYVSQMYSQAKEIERAYGTWRMLVKEGKAEEAKEFAADHADELARHARVERTKRHVTRINARIRAVQGGDQSADEKRDQIRVLQEQKDRFARTLEPA